MRFTALGVEMVTTSPPGAPVAVSARFGPVFRRLIDSMAPAVRALVDGGNAVIFDHVLHDQAMYDSWRRAASGLDVFTVGVTCPLDILEARERARGDRVLGRARGLVDVVHTFCAYDVTVDTGAMDTTPAWPRCSKPWPRVPASREKAWLWCQSNANPSPCLLSVNRGKYRGDLAERVVRHPSVSKNPSSTVFSRLFWVSDIREQDRR